MILAFQSLPSLKHSGTDEISTEIQQATREESVNYADKFAVLIAENANDLEFLVMKVKKHSKKNGAMTKYKED